MKQLISKALMTVVFLSMSLAMFAGAAPPPTRPPGPTGPPCWPPPCIPVDNGIVVMIVASLLFGAFLIMRSRKTRLNTIG